MKGSGRKEIIDLLSNKELMKSSLNDAYNCWTYTIGIHLLVL
jgi:hypothetical protein